MGAEGSSAYYRLKGDIGRFLVCGNRAHVMDEEEILITHKYLMEEWKINEKAGKRGPRGVAGPKGDKGDAGERGLQGLRGLRGEPGVSGIIDILQWMPATVLKNLQTNDESACFFIEKSSDIVKKKTGEVITWVSRSKNVLSAEKPSRDIITLPNDRRALSFKKNRYVSDDIMFFPNHRGTYGFFCITFRCVGHDKQAIISNFQKEETKYFHEIDVTESEINIWGIKDSKLTKVIIQHDTRAWTTLFVEYLGLGGITKCHYSINNDPHFYGDFTFDTYYEMMSGCSVGSRYDNTQFFQGDIASMEFYHVEKCKGNTLPIYLKDLVIRNQLIT